MQYDLYGLKKKLRIFSIGMEILIVTMGLAHVSLANVLWYVSNVSVKMATDMVCTVEGGEKKKIGFMKFTKLDCSAHSERNTKNVLLLAFDKRAKVTRFFPRSPYGRSPFNLS